MTDMTTDNRFSMTIWQVAREMSPFAEAGGIKDVVSGLSLALSRQGIPVTVVLPMYAFLARYSDDNPICEIDTEFIDGEETLKVYQTIWNNIRILFLSAPCFTGKDRVYTYSRDEESVNPQHHYGKGHLDSHEMNLTLQFGALEAAMALGEKPSVFHLHDGHCGFLPALMKEHTKYKDYFSQTTSLLTIHNGGIVYQQNIISLDEAKKLTGLSEQILEKTQTESGYNPIICAALFGNINTVSEGYAKQILDGTDANSGELGCILNHHQISLWGITNGIEPESHDSKGLFKILLEGSAHSFEKKKRECKSTLLEQIQRINTDIDCYGSSQIDIEKPLITIQSRIAYQKGIDIFIDFVKEGIGDINAHFLVVGEGEHSLENELAEAASSSGNFTYIRLYNKSLSDSVFAGGDFFLIPSRWEPCGLTDFIAQMNGNIPIVHSTGGLVKTVDGVNGFAYDSNTAHTLRKKIREVIDLYGDQKAFLQEIRRSAVNLINERFTWQKVLVQRYLPLYENIIQQK